MASHCVQQVIQNTDADSTSTFAHGRHHSPLVGLGVVAFDAGDGVAAAPAADCEAEVMGNEASVIFGSFEEQ